MAVNVDTYMKSLTAAFALSILKRLILFCCEIGMKFVEGGWYLIMIVRVIGKKVVLLKWGEFKKAGVICRL